MNGLEHEDDRDPVTSFDAELPPAAKKTRKPRRQHDAYLTLDDLALAICRRLAVYFPDPRRIIEPTAGEGAFVRAARQVWPSAVIVAIDLVADGYAEKCIAAGSTKFIQMDAREVNYHGADLVLGNPPFGAAAPILRRIRESNPTAAIGFLLPVGFVGRTKGVARGKAPDLALARDAAFWRLVERTYSSPIHPRPSFTNDGKTDRMEYEVSGFGHEAWPRAHNLDEPIVWRPE